MRTNWLLILALLALGALLIGCESDSTTPDDELPPITGEDVAQQSGYMASAMVRVLPRIWDPVSNKDDGEYQFTFATGPVIGTIYSEFRDVEGGALVDYDVAGWGRVFTDAPLAISFFDDGVPWLLSFDIAADIDQGAGTAVADGAGTLVVDDYEAEFTVVGVVVEEGDDYPAAGIITFVHDDVVATVTFDGDDIVTITADGESITIDLDDGSVVD